VPVPEPVVVTGTRDEIVTESVPLNGSVAASLEIAQKVTVKVRPTAAQDVRMGFLLHRGWCEGEGPIAREGKPTGGVPGSPLPWVLSTTSRKVAVVTFLRWAGRGVAALHPLRGVQGRVQPGEVRWRPPGRPYPLKHLQHCNGCQTIRASLFVVRPRVRVVIMREGVQGSCTPRTGPAD